MNILIFGCGPHCKRIYVGTIKLLNINKLIIVDLKEKERDIKNYLSKSNISNYELILVENIKRNDEQIDKKLEELLNEYVEKYEITKAIISTEPRAHYVYINYCLKNGLDILCDKPLTTPLNPINDGYNALKIYNDYENLVEKYRESSSNLFEIQVQRRFHAGYEKIHDIISEVVHEFKVPITKIKINHCDGMWNMPNELIFRENHPYKYGYGKLMHSGYHFIDLLTYFLDINCQNGFKFDDYNLMVSDYRASDFYKYYNEKLFERINFKENVDVFSNVDIFRNFGELDVSSVIEFKDKGENIVTTAILDLCQSGYSKRSWFNLPEDTYKGNGRVRHELFEITVGPFINIKVISFQAKEIKDYTKNENNIGDIDHFQILVFRNSKIIGGKPFEIINLNEIEEKDDMFIGFNELARRKLIYKFLNNEKTISNIETQGLGIEILSKMYESMSRRYKKNKEFRIAVEALIKYDNKYLICKRNESLSIAPGIWNVPAGKIFSGENIEECLKRKVKEEVNLDLIDSQYKSYKIINNKNYNRLVFLYECEVKSINNLKIKDSDFSEYRFIDYRDLIGNNEFDDLHVNIKDIIMEAN